MRCEKIIFDMKNKNKKHFQAHFRKFHSKQTTGHPQYVYGEDGREYLVIGITKAPLTNGVLNIELERNPEPKNNDKAYLRPKPDKVNKGIRNERLKGWGFSDNDKKKVQAIISGGKKKKPRDK